MSSWDGPSFFLAFYGFRRIHCNLRRPCFLFNLFNFGGNHFLLFFCCLFNLMRFWLLFFTLPLICFPRISTFSMAVSDTKSTSLRSFLGMTQHKCTPSGLVYRIERKRHGHFWLKEEDQAHDNPRFDPRTEKGCEWDRDKIWMRVNSRTVAKVLGPTITWSSDPTKALGVPRESDFEGQWDLITELPEEVPWGKQGLLEDTNKTLCALGPRGK